MTAGYEDAIVISMASKRTGAPIPRDSTTPTAYKLALAMRIKDRREALGLSQKDVAERLSAACRREIRVDSYRKWETDKAIVQVDAILPLCDILQIHPFEFLARTPPALHDKRPATPEKAVA